MRLDPAWQVADARKGSLPLQAEWCVIGSGAGGAVAAARLAQAGRDVLLLEAGGLFLSPDFPLTEAWAYPHLYQDSAARRTQDKGINIYQGRAVGGTTLVNWTSSFRTPESTLSQWQQVHGLREFTPESLAPHFTRMEQRLNVAQWQEAPNPNNQALVRGLGQLGLPWARLRRNVKGCLDLGACGLGCPVDGKQSMAITLIPDFLRAGGRLLHHAKVTQLAWQGAGIQTAWVQPQSDLGQALPGAGLQVKAKFFVLAGGGINSPGLLLASDAPNPHGTLGQRTFLHPTLVSMALMPEEVHPYQGAPQSIYSDAFMGDPAGPAGFKLEVPPIHPLLAATNLPGFGRQHGEWMAQLPHTQALIALLRDGFHEASPGGQVVLRQGHPVLDYAMSDYLWQGARRAWLAMAEVQFAAGAKAVMPLHADARPYASWKQAQQALATLPLETPKAKVVSAHVMGGCAMGPDPQTSVVAPSGQHHQLKNLWVLDGSLFPTSIGANPQLSIFGLVDRLMSTIFHHA